MTVDSADTPSVPSRMIPPYIRVNSYPLVFSAVGPDRKGNNVRLSSPPCRFIKTQRPINSVNEITKRTTHQVNLCLDECIRSNENSV
jgi:hypothetical protein